MSAENPADDIAVDQAHGDQTTNSTNPNNDSITTPPSQQIDEEPLQQQQQQQTTNNIQQQTKTTTTTAASTDAPLPCNSMKMINNAARISSFQMSDGPLGISLNVYDGKSLKYLVATLLDTVNDQARTIHSYETRFQQLHDKIDENYELQEAKTNNTNNALQNLAQNIQGFVDEEGPQPEQLLPTVPSARNSPVHDRGRSPSPVRRSPSPSPERRPPANAKINIQIDKNSPVNISQLPPKSPEPPTIPSPVPFSAEPSPNASPVSVQAASPVQQPSPESIKAPSPR